MRTAKIIPFLAGAGIAGLAWLHWARSERNAVGAEAYATALSPERDSRVILSAPGVTEPRSRTVQIFGEISGMIRAIHVSAGDHASKGQLLVELNNDLQKASSDLAQAAVDRVQADLERLKNGDRPGERGILKAQLDETNASLRLAEFEWQRVQRMMKQNATSEKEVADARNTLALAQARRDAAMKRLELSEAGSRAEDVAHAQAAVREAQAQLAAARGMVERTYIRSPIDGIVVYRFREPGEAVFTDKPTPILTVGDRSRLHVRVDVDEIDIAHVHVGQAVYATAPAFGDRRFPGRVVHIEPTLGRKNFRTNRPTERIDTKVQEVVVALDRADELPIELQVIVWFLNGPEPAASEDNPGS
jgi:HlyD family secretion protein